MTPVSKYLFGDTHPGKERNNNEDTFLSESVSDGHIIIACVIDGVGGYEGGEIAAAIARESIQEYFQKPLKDLATSVREALLLANDRIHQNKAEHPENADMACVVTLAVADMKTNLFYYAHVGDTRLYLFRDQTLVKITRDHSFVGFLEDANRITEEEAMRHPKRYEINKALGFDPTIASISDYIEVGKSPFLPDDILFLCSDGVTDMINSATITNILRSESPLPEKVKKIIEAANEAGGKDNVTAVLVQNNNHPVVHEATKPLSIKKNEEAKRESTNLTEKKKISWVVPFLTVACLILIAILIWKSYAPANEQEQSLNTIVERPGSKKLTDSLNAFARLTLRDSVYGRSVVLTRSINFHHDSIDIDGAGIILRADSAFLGPAFIIQDSCDVVFMKNIIFENFTTAIISNDVPLNLTNVRFKNCQTPVQYNFRLPEKTMRVQFPDSIYLNSDTIPNP